MRSANRSAETFAGEMRVCSSCAPSSSGDDRSVARRRHLSEDAWAGGCLWSEDLPTRIARLSAASPLRARRDCCDCVATEPTMRPGYHRRRLRFLASHLILDSAERARREHRHPESVDTRKSLPPLTH